MNSLSDDLGVQGVSASIDKLNRSQEIECINELDSENEFSYMDALAEDEKAVSLRNPHISSSSI